MDIGESVKIISKGVVEQYRLPEENSGEIIDNHDVHGFDFVVEVRDDTGDIRHLSVREEELKSV